MSDSHYPYITSVQGAFGRVLAATLHGDTDDDRTVAVKTVQGQYKPPGNFEPLLCSYFTLM